MDTITTVIERQWLAEIVDGSKRIECCENNPYWTNKLAKVEAPFRLALCNGMRPPVPIVTVRIDRVVPSPGAGERSQADGSGTASRCRSSASEPRGGAVVGQEGEARIRDAWRPMAGSDVPRRGGVLSESEHGHDNQEPKSGVRDSPVWQRAHRTL